jgi:hypothetical protein
MRRKFVWIGWLSFVLASCGPAYPAFGTQKSDAGRSDSHLHPWEIPAQNLDLKWIVSSGQQVCLGGWPENLSCPDLKRWLASGVVVENSVRSNSHQAFFEKVIFLDDLHEFKGAPTNEFFITWSDKKLGARLVDSSATHQVLAGNNQFIGSEYPVAVWNDPTDNVWFVRVRELFHRHKNYSDRRITEADTQILSLHLFFENQAHARVEVQFRVSTNLNENRNAK